MSRAPSDVVPGAPSGAAPRASRTVVPAASSDAAPSTPGAAARTPLSPLHPASWWVWAACLVVLAAVTTNLWVLAGIIAIAIVTVRFAPAQGPGWEGYRLYLWLGAAIVVFRLVYRVIFQTSGSTDALITLPTLVLPRWLGGFHLFGPVSAAGLMAGLADGMRLAATILAIGAAACLASPRRLLSLVPAALHEVATALVVALAVLPQLAESLARVRRARRLRGGGDKRRHLLRDVVVPVASDAVDRSLALAAAMESRGFGRRSPLPLAQRRLGAAALVAGLVALAVGAYGLLDPTLPTALGLALLGLGAGVGCAGLWLAGRGVIRSRYRPARWGARDAAMLGCAVVASAAALLAGRLEPAAMSPILSTPAIPPLPALALLALACGAIPLVAGLAGPREAAA